MNEQSDRISQNVDDELNRNINLKWTKEVRRSLFCVMSVGCGPKTARLYNIDSGQVLEAKYWGSGHGRIELTMPDGELCRGEFVTVSDSEVHILFIPFQFRHLDLLSGLECPGQPPCSSITSSISPMMRIVSFRATTIFW